MTSRSPIQSEFFDDGVAQWIVLVVAILILASFISFNLPFSIHADALTALDEGTYVYDGLRVVQGEVPYRDFFSFLGPVPTYFSAAIFKVTGPYAPAARALHFLLLAIAAMSLFRISRRLNMSTGMSVGLTLGHLLAISMIWPLAYHHWVAVSIAIVALDHATNALKRESPHRGHLVAAGIFSAASLLSVQSYGAPLLAAITVGILSQRKSRDNPALMTTTTFWNGRHITEVDWRTLALFLSGVAVFMIPVLVSLAIAGALPQMIYSCWVWPFENYVSLNRVPYASDLAVYTTAVSAWPWLSRTAAESALFLLVVLPVFSAVVGAVTLAFVFSGKFLKPSNLRSTFPTVITVSLWTIAVMLPLLTGRTRADIAHITFASVGVIIGCWCPFVVLRVPRVQFFRRLFGIIIAVWFISTSIVWMHRHREIGLRPADFAQANQRVRATSGADVITDFSDGAPVVRVGWSSGWLHFYGAPAISRYTYLLAPSTGYNTFEQWTDVANSIAAHKPALVMASPSEYQTLIRARPDIEGAYDYRLSIAVNRQWLGDETGGSQWVLVHSGYFTGFLSLSHYGHRVIGEVVFGEGQPEIVFGTMEGASIRLIRVWPTGFYQTHLGSLDDDGTRGRGDLIDNYGVRTSFELIRRSGLE